MELYWEYQCHDGGFMLLTRDDARDAYLRDIPSYDKRRHMKRKQDASSYAEGLEDADALVRYPDAQAEIQRLRAEIAGAIPAMRDYARNNPRCVYQGDAQDPNGAHAWLARNDPPNSKLTGPR